jgi:phage/plasmid primase-like uncharacterized protein
MANKTYTEQILEHLSHLQSHWLNVTELRIDPLEWVRCHSIGESKGRGEFAYVTNTEKLSNGLLGIRTSFRGPKGSGSYKTYGLWPNGGDEQINMQCQSIATETKTSNDLHEQAARKAYGFWKHSSFVGTSDYLKKKGVGNYGIRFRSSEEHGNVAVVPMFDAEGKLWSYQLLNPDGTKRHPKDSRTEGLFHMLRVPKNGELIGIAESYVTAATCLELSGIPVVCAFSSGNLPAVTKSLCEMYQNSRIVIFSDNDRHLEVKGMPNQGLLKAQESKNIEQTKVYVVAPDFGDCEASKEFSDWNDLALLKGVDEARRQISINLKIKNG